MKRTQKIITGLVSVASIALAASAFAQPAGGMGPGHGPGAGMGQGCGQGMGGMGMHGAMGMGPMHGPGGFAQGNPAAATEGRLAYLKTELKITAAQESAWNAFAAKVRKQSESMQALREKVRDGALPAPERLAQHAEAMKQRVAGMEGMAAALKDLYAALTTDQKAIVDKHFAGHGPGALAWNGPRR